MLKKRANVIFATFAKPIDATSKECKWFYCDEYQRRENKTDHFA